MRCAALAKKTIQRLEPQTLNGGSGSRDSLAAQRKAVRAFLGLVSTAPKLDFHHAPIADALSAIWIYAKRLLSDIAVLLALSETAPCFYQNRRVSSATNANIARIELMGHRDDRPQSVAWIICLMMFWQVLSPVLWFGSGLKWYIFFTVQVIGVLAAWAMWRGHFWIRWLTMAGCVLSLPDILSVIQPRLTQTLARGVNIALSLFLLYWFNTGSVRNYYRRHSSTTARIIA
jgi:hypothetical protein